MSARRVTTTRTIGNVTLHLHQTIHVAKADPERLRWFPSDYMIADLTASVQESGDADGASNRQPGIRLVALPLDDDPPAAKITAAYAESLFEKSHATVSTNNGIPMWAY